MISVRRSKTLEILTLVHTRKKEGSSLSRMAQRWSGSRLEERVGSQCNIIPVVLGSTTPCNSMTTICIWLTLCLRSASGGHSVWRWGWREEWDCQRQHCWDNSAKEETSLLRQATTTGAGLSNSAVLGDEWTWSPIWRSWWGGGRWSGLKELWHMGGC